MPKLSRRALCQIALRSAAPTVLITIVGCGTILNPERKGQPAGRIDWKIAALDGLGLILFFVPGVIAFAVDFNNGTIYLPPERTTSDLPDEPATEDLRPVSCGVLRPAYSDIERVLREESNLTVDLREQHVRQTPLSSITEFWKIRAMFMRSYPESNDRQRAAAQTLRAERAIGATSVARSHAPQ